MYLQSELHGYLLSFFFTKQILKRPEKQSYPGWTNKLFVQVPDCIMYMLITCTLLYMYS